MTVELLAAKLIQSFEGCRLTAYWDANGKKWTIGYGHTVGVAPGMVISLQQAADFLARDSALLFVLVQGQPLIAAAALVSFGYNCGRGALQRVMSGEIRVDHEEFMAGSLPYGESAGGVPMAGLKSRRQLEAALIEAARS